MKAYCLILERTGQWSNDEIMLSGVVEDNFQGKKGDAPRAGRDLSSNREILIIFCFSKTSRNRENDLLHLPKIKIWDCLSMFHAFAGLHPTMAPLDP